MRFISLLPVLSLLQSTLALVASVRDVPKPVFLIVPGAWHVPAHYISLVGALEVSGYDTDVVTLPCASKGPPFAPYQSDLDAVTAKLTAHVNNGDDVIMVMHSYGGVPGSGAVKGLTKAARTAAGLKGGVIGLVYMAAFAFDDNVGFGNFDLSGLTWLTIHPNVDPSLAYISVPNSAATFYNDVTPPALVNYAVSLIKNESLAIFGAVQSYAAWHDVHPTYILTTNDQAFPPSLQTFFSSQAGAFGGWDVVPIASGHAPWLSHLVDVTTTLVNVAKKLTGNY